LWALRVAEDDAVSGAREDRSELGAHQTGAEDADAHAAMLLEFDDELRTLCGLPARPAVALAQGRNGNDEEADAARPRPHLCGDADALRDHRRCRVTGAFAGSTHHDRH